MLLNPKQRDRRGAMMIMVALVLVILLIAAVFSIDVAYMHSVRAELRTATDAAAQAGSEALARTQDPVAARARAVEVAALNTVAGRPLNIAPSDIEIGGVTPGPNNRLIFQPNGSPATAVRVRGGRTGSDSGGSVNLFFSRVFNTNEFNPVQFATAASAVRDVSLVLDVSGSMNSRSNGTTRLQALKDAVNIFLDEVELLGPNTQVSLTTYSNRATLRSNLTSNIAQIRTSVSGLRARGTTNVGGGLLLGSNTLENPVLARPFAERAVVVMTDGRHNTGLNPLTAALQVAARGHSIHAVTFSRGADQARMRQVAAQSNGGSFIHADSAADLGEAFRDIARSLFVKLID